MSATAYAEQLSAMLDGELPPEEMAAMATHLASCADCARHLAELAALRSALQDTVPDADAPPEFYARISGLLEAPAGNVVAFRAHPVRRNASWVAAGAAIAAMLVLLLLPHPDPTRDLMSVRDAALRGGVSQMAGNVAAPLASGFRLVSARADIVAGHKARVFAYARADQTVTLCIWPANGEPAHGVRAARYRGMAIRYWNDGSQEFWAASNGAAATLDDFVTALRGA